MYQEEFKKINETRVEINSYYINSLSKIGSSYFGESLSESTRKRQNILLISSIITILVAFAIITPLEGELGGIKYQFSNVAVFKKLAATLTSYFFIVYIINAVRDIRLYHYQNLPAILEMRQLIDKLKQAISDRAERMDKLEKEFDKRLSVRSEEQEELRKLFDEIESEEFKDFVELEKEMLAKDGVGDLTELITGEALDHSINEKFKSILEIQKIYKLHNFLNVFVEIIFPLGLAIYAIYIGFI